jgi:molybdopterin/thiamine biosynthesis adenylyltransferase
MKMEFEAQHLTRQLDLVPLEILGERITVIGAGAIGSWVTLALAKMGFENITVFDDDVVSWENMSSQFFRHADVGALKTVALQRMVQDFTGTTVGIRSERYLGDQTFAGIVICAVDSMEARRTVWERHANKSPFTRAIIDPRMGAETALLYVMNPMDDKDRESFEKSLYGDSEAVQERCTAKATIYTANMLSGLVCKAVKDLLTKPDYLRTAQWNISMDAFDGHRKKVSQTA